MDSLKTRVVISATEETADSARAIVSRVLANQLLQASHDRSDSADTTESIKGLSELALCIEFEKTVEDAALWQSSFGNGRVADIEDRAIQIKGRGKDVLLIWAQVSEEEVSIHWMREGYMLMLCRPRRKRNPSPSLNIYLKHTLPSHTSSTTLKLPPSSHTHPSSAHQY